MSRGYGRKTKGFRLATTDDTPQTIGDEPAQYIKNLSDVAAVAVGENRPLAISSLLQLRPETKAVIMDDGFQHRYVTPSLSVVLTTFQSPFFEDKILPAGCLRESRKGAKRADIIVVTKCPDNLPQKEREHYRQQINIYTKAGTPVFFSYIKYGQPQPVFEKSNHWHDGKPVVLVSGLARPQVLESYVVAQFNFKKHIAFADHYNYKEADFDKMAEEAVKRGATLLTTEKDAVKWQISKYAKKHLSSNSFYLPLEVAFLEEADKFNNLIIDHVKNFS